VTEKLTVEMLAKRAGMANVEMMNLAERAGIKFDSPQSEINQEQHTKLQKYLAKPAKSGKTLSLTGGARPKLSLGAMAGAASGGPNIVRKRTIVQTRDTEELDRQAARRRQLDSTRVAPQRQSETEAPKPKTTTGVKGAAATETDAADTPAAHPDQQVKKTVRTTTRAKPGAVKGGSRADEGKSERDDKQDLESTTKPPSRMAEKKTRRSRGGGRSKGRESNEELQLNEFHRRQGVGRSQERTEPLKSTLLTQEFSIPAGEGPKELELGEQIQVGELAHMMGVKAGQLIKELMKLKVMATVNQSVDYDTAEIAAHAFDYTVRRKEDISLESLAVGDEDAQLPGEKRSPVITVMGHVDHGKTSLLDYIRRAKVAEGESGGITQHIGAYHVRNEKGGMTFLDTPGHAAFTAMRARGAEVTDIVILVVAADDKVMPQTIEAIQHARSAKVPIVVALNKTDRPEADPDRLINELSAQELVPESWGGDTQFVQVSAHTGKGIDELLEAVMLQAEVLELKAPRQGRARGAVIESRLDKNRGPVATVLVSQGLLKPGAHIIAGASLGRVRAMQNERGETITEAGPSMPVEILGLGETPEAGDEMIEVANERAARELIEERRDQRRLKAQPARRKIADPFSDEPQAKVLPLVVKADTQGSVGAILHALGELENDQFELNIVLSGVGGITESDAGIAHATGARLVGFNVRAEKKAEAYCEKEGVPFKYYSVIYELIEEIDNSLHGLLDPIIEEQILGVAEVRDVFNVSKFGKIAGCMVTDGAVLRNKPIRVLRDNVVIYEGELESLKRFKDDAKEVRAGMECGIGVRNYKDVKAGDKIEVFDRKEQRPSRRQSAQAR